MTGTKILGKYLEIGVSPEGKRIMRSHEKLKEIYLKSDIIKKYDAIGIITILTIISLTIQAITILKACQSPKGVALIIKAGGPLVRLFVRRNIYKSMIKSGVSAEDAKILSENMTELIQQLSLEELEDLIAVIFEENKETENE